MFSQIHQNLLLTSKLRDHVEFEKEFRSELIEFFSAEIEKNKNTDSPGVGAFDILNKINQAFYEAIVLCHNNPDINEVYKKLNDLIQSFDKGKFYEELKQCSNGFHDERVNDMEGALSLKTLGYFTRDLPKKLMLLEQRRISEKKINNQYQSILDKTYFETIHEVSQYLILKLREEYPILMSEYQSQYLKVKEIERKEKELTEKQTEKQKRLKTLEFRINNFLPELKKDLERKQELMNDDERLKEANREAIDRAINYAHLEAASAADSGDYNVKVDEAKITESILMQEKEKISRDIQDLQEKIETFEKNPEYQRLRSERDQITGEEFQATMQLAAVQDSLQKNKKELNNYIGQLKDIPAGKAVEELKSLKEKKSYEGLDAFFVKPEYSEYKEILHDDFQILQNISTDVVNKLIDLNGIDAEIYQNALTMQDKTVSQQISKFVVTNTLLKPPPHIDTNTLITNRRLEVYEDKENFTREDLVKVTQAEGQFRKTFEQTVQELVSTLMGEEKYQKKSKNNQNILIDKLLLQLTMEAGQNKLYPWQLICLPVILETLPKESQNAKIKKLQDKMLLLGRIMQESIRTLNESYIGMNYVVKNCHIVIAEMVKEDARQLGLEHLLNQQEKEIPEKWLIAPEVFIHCSVERRKILEQLKKMRADLSKTLENESKNIYPMGSKDEDKQIFKGYLDICALGVLRHIETEIASGKTLDEKSIENNFDLKDFPLTTKMYAKEVLAKINLTTKQVHIEIESPKENKSTMKLDAGREKELIKLNKLNIKYLEDWNNALKKYKNSYVEEGSEAYVTFTRISQKIATTNYIKEQLQSGNEIDAKIIMKEVKSRFDNRIFTKKTFGGNNQLESFIYKLPNLKATASPQQRLSSASISLASTARISKDVSMGVQENKVNELPTPVVKQPEIARGKESESPRKEKQRDFWSELASMPQPKNSLPSATPRASVNNKKSLLG